MPDKLEERLREVCIDWTGEPIVDDSTPRYEVLCGLLREAADEITRLKGEVERLTAWAEGPAGVKWHTARTLEYAEKLEAAETALAAKQALIDELVEGLGFYRDEWQKAQHPFGMAGLAMTPTHRLLCDYGERAEALISKARSSGKAGSDA